MVELFNSANQSINLLNLAHDYIIIVGVSVSQPHKQ